MLYSIVIPCYKSSKTIRKVVEMTMQEMDRLDRREYEFVLVDDCSPDDGETMAALMGLVRDYACVKVVELAKNAGQHNAVMAGLNEGSGDVFIAMDDDMQTHPSQLGKLLDEFDKGYDIVYGYYEHKEHSKFRNFGSYVNYMTVRILLKKPKDLKTSSFWVIRKFVRDYAVEYKSAYTHLQGLFLRTTRNISSVPIQHFKREVGTSNYTLKKLIKLWSNILGFSIVPLQMATYTGFFFSLIGILAAIGVIILKFVRPATYIGWPSMMATICFFSGLNLMFMGIIGEYVGRIFLGMSKNPQYVVRQVHHRDASDEEEKER
ncbi:Undecaprenyl-phosphate 4-deoxy-4-formamido-L-arabinose transferase [uncultured Clostridium sp.]|uniref:Glycosyltransferase n=1 Tax=Muricoprocola aceti TaxID=2981772 RepID=A0ABT2SM75_9FIRM|nr:glycosyltransferase [Muricoprocola aceti]MCI7226353.1 glycosyltransferase [Lachnospiraceae bacterium]MCQ4774779.1 glycosyltransferase [Lacrimispora saccharolytica]SCH42582.1 Undecaprenyl-phosphate 4-deoxy-4-formamido-L-arabinose transferase [uncultured Clostridium sp.]MCU6725193.1 glycosyltransferase [Muricoprocola aceti]MDD7434822.1 glycosyltransferase [Lachnospiraceae bacterium]